MRKPRHNPDKPQNNYGGDEQCKWFDGYSQDGETVICEAGIHGAKCKGNVHNCKSEHYKLLASVKPEKRPFVKR